LELPVLLSLGALLSESLSTRRDSVRAPDRLCLDEDRLEPEDRLREPERDEDDRVFDFLEEFPPERLLLLDRDFCRGILPTLLKLRNGVRALPESFRSNLGQVAVQIRCSAGKSNGTAGAKRRSWHGSQVRR
jgi:hypothetical protein